MGVKGMLKIGDIVRVVQGEHVSTSLSQEFREEWLGTYQILNIREQLFILSGPRPRFPFFEEELIKVITSISEEAEWE